MSLIAFESFDLFGSNGRVAVCENVLADTRKATLEFSLNAGIFVGMTAFADLRGDTVNCPDTDDLFARLALPLLRTSRGAKRQRNQTRGGYDQQRNRAHFVEPIHVQSVLFSTFVVKLSPEPARGEREEADQHQGDGNAHDDPDVIAGLTGAGVLLVDFDMVADFTSGHGPSPSAQRVRPFSACPRQGESVLIRPS